MSRGPEPRVRAFQAPDWRLYRELRLSALKESPDAFGGTFAESAARPEDQWRTRLTDAPADTDLPLLGLVGDEPAGLAWGKIEVGDRDTATVYQMWVAPAHRRTGLGRLLLTSVIDWAKARDARRVLLGVTCGDSPARKLYNSVGFLPAGPPEALRAGSPLRAQPMQLALTTDRPAQP